ncbi:Dinitrogenase iron-molybdenum cofactor [Anaerohalosphaera lusitana]|uniref:Dinitrogenase iron-molybdenum cofactor n=1 Tax=Anaerohalosphaera lusitana TaxID=1936003 RepID=A0A1U9NL56_9BACT|nr:NifB/NifX family molybdenum-iron cluster-binding protein [Anaerohalosphaera lusitana]AQT68639.1 Dinitrogenase iron-molybdenum cofactor [Anaerohalosphaera lusitana]
MRIAVPVSENVLSPHFGHCQEFALFCADENKKITAEERLAPPKHEPGILPQWLGGLSVNTVIAGGMGTRAQQLFTANNIDVVVGAPSQEPREVVEAYLAGQLQCGDNVCDH